MQGGLRETDTRIFLGIGYNDRGGFFLLMKSIFYLLSVGNHTKKGFCFR